MSLIKTEHVNCPVCGEGWAYPPPPAETQRINKSEKISLEDFVGQTLAEVKDHFAAKTDAVYFMQPDTCIQNDSRIDLTLKYPDTDKSWRKDVKVNPTGWVGESEGITDDYVIQESDSGHFNVWQFFHPICKKKYLTDWYQERFQKVFDEAGFPTVILTAIANRYCGCEHCGPWFKVETGIGEFTIGWRKRVINIEGSCVNFSELFSEENVTQGANHVHAWGWDKATEYMTTILNHVRRTAT